MPETQQHPKPRESLDAVLAALIAGGLVTLVVEMRGRRAAKSPKSGLPSPRNTSDPVPDQKTKERSTMNLKPGLTLIKESFQEWQKDGALDLGAALAYYAIFSLAPLLLIVIAVAGLVWGRDAVQGQLIGQLRGLVGEQGGQAIQTMVANAGKQGGSGVLATIVGVVTILFGATGVFVQLQSSLDHIWNVEPRPGGGIWSFVKTRMLSFGMVLGIGFLLLISLVVTTAVSAVGAWATGLLPAAKVLVEGAAFVLSFVLITLLFAMIFKVLPDVKIAWRDVWIVAAVTAFLFTVGKFLIGFYLAKSSVASTYGAAGSLVIVLLWIYYSSQILFLGAEFTQVYASHYGGDIRPSKHAVPIVQKKEVASAREWPPAQGKEAPEGSRGGDRRAGGA